jgi:phosphatidate cytidylyltransferase
MARAMTSASPVSPPSKALVFVRRGLSTLLLWGVVAAAFASRWTWVYLGLVTLLTLVATLEYFSMAARAGVKCHGRFALVLTAVYCALLHGVLAGPLRLPPGWELAVVALMLCGAFVLQLRQPVAGRETLEGVMVSLGGFIYIPVLFGFTAKLLALDPAWLAEDTVAMPAAMLLVWLLAVTKFSDMGAYLTGSLIGRHKLIPHVSPGKTWEGFAGGLAFSQLAACGLYGLFPQHFAIMGGWGHVIVLGFLLGVLAVVGDLAESVVKRALGAKDSGRMLPGIGGALDLIDSICFTAPALYCYLLWLNPALR